MDQDEMFVIAVKRGRRDDVPPDWMETVRATPGIAVMGDPSEARLQVRATPDAIARIRERLSEYLHIEKMIPHSF
jgi:hypothetical protein